MERGLKEKFFDEFLESLSTQDRNIFKVYELKFRGENYPLCEETLKEMFDVIIKNGENNQEKFLAIASMFFTLLDIYGK